MNNYTLGTLTKHGIKQKVITTEDLDFIIDILNLYSEEDWGEKEKQEWKSNVNNAGVKLKQKKDKCIVYILKPLHWLESPEKPKNLHDPKQFYNYQSKRLERENSLFWFFIESGTLKSTDDMFYTI